MVDYANVGEVLARVQDTIQFDDRPIRSIDDRGMFGDTPLVLIMTWDDVEAARLLLEAGASVDLQGEDGDTALHRAALPPANVELIRLLLNAGASCDIKNDEAETPLDIARLSGDAEIIRLLSGDGQAVKS